MPHLASSFTMYTDCQLCAYVMWLQAASDYCRAVGGELVPYLDDDGYGEQLYNATALRLSVPDRPLCNRTMTQSDMPP